MTTVWEVSYTVTITLEREGEDNDPSTREAIEIDHALKTVLEDAEIDEINDWTVEDWLVDTA